MYSYGPHDISLPSTPEAAYGAAQMLAMVDSFQDRLVGVATDAADRDSRFNGIKPGSLVASWQMRTLWLRTDTAWITLFQDTGWVTTGFSASPGWSDNGSRVSLLNGWVALDVTVLRTGATLTANAYGNITGDPAVVTIPDGFRPSRNFFASFHGTTTSGGAAISPLGTVSILDAHANATLDADANSTFGVTTSYRIG